MAQEGSKKAEDQFRNIQSLKGVDATEVIPAMDFMSSSLGVGCDFCHVQDRASDEKEEKKTARKMIAMMRDINEKNFDGHTEVTCATCHNGHADPSGLAPVQDLSRGFKPNPNLTPAQIMDKYTAAIGGQGRASKLKSLHRTGQVTSDKDHSQVEVYAETPDKVSIKAPSPRGLRTISFDGTHSWFAMGSQSQQIPNRSAARFIREGRVLWGDWLPQFSSSMAGTTELHGKQMNVIRGTMPSGHYREMLYFDASTGLLARIIDFDESIFGSTPDIRDYSDYRKAAGVLIPFKVVEHSAEGDSTIVYTKTEANPKIAESVFAPAG